MRPHFGQETIHCIESGTAEVLSDRPWRKFFPDSLLVIARPHFGPLWLFEEQLGFI
jgi:hypothetical protein